MEGIAYNAMNYSTLAACVENTIGDGEKCYMFLVLLDQLPAMTKAIYGYISTLIHG